MALSMGDALTGIPNRRNFDEHLKQEWQRGLRTRRPLSMILMDIDHFSKHSVGAGSQIRADVISTGGMRC